MNDIAVIRLQRDDFAIVDAEDFQMVRKFKWFRQVNGYIGRNRTSEAKPDTLHRVINNTPDGLKTDHINHCRADNTKRNLRTVENRQNLWNSRKRPDPTSSRHKGVSWNKEKGKWQTNICVNGRRMTLGRFDSEDVAAACYNSAAKRFYGEYACLNKIDYENIH